MKKILFVLVALLVFTWPASLPAADFYFLGINAKWIKKADWKQVALGAVLSPVVHELGHIAVMELTGTPYRWVAPAKFEFDQPDESTARWICRSGFIAQHGFGLLLTSFQRESDFTRGYTASSFFLHGTYLLRNQKSGDVNTMNNNHGNGHGEWAAFGALAVHNLLRIEW